MSSSDFAPAARHERILGQAAPLATTEADLYEVPAAKSATVTVICTNRGSSATVRVSVGVGGAATANGQYLAYDEVIPATKAVSTVEFRVGPGDIIRVYASSGNFSFTCTGIEEDD